MLLPKLTQLLWSRFVDFEDSFSHFQPFLNQLLQILLFKGLFIDCKIAFSLVESHIRRMNAMVFKQSLLDISKWNSLFFFHW